MSAGGVCGKSASSYEMPPIESDGTGYYSSLLCQENLLVELLLLLGSPSDAYS